MSAISLPAAEPAPLECHIVDIPAYTRVDFDGCEASQIGDLYRALAIRLLQSEVRCVLFKWGVDGADHAVLHDVLRMLLRTRERPARLKLALLEGLPRLEQTFQRLERDFRMTGIDVRLVQDESEAQAWFSEPDHESHPA